MDINLLIEQLTSLIFLEKDKNQNEIYISIRNELINYRDVITELKVMVFQLSNLLKKLEGGKKSELLHK